MLDNPLDDGKLIMRHLSRGEINMENRQSKDTTGQLIAIDRGLSRLDKRIDGVETALCKLANTIENTLSTKINALYDANMATEELMNSLAISIEQLTLKINTLQMETAHIRRVK